MTMIAMAYLAGCVTVPLAAWGLYRYDRWQMRDEE
jgi:hypothetical protein